MTLRLLYLSFSASTLAQFVTEVFYSWQQVCRRRSETVNSLHFHLHFAFFHFWRPVDMFGGLCAARVWLLFYLSVFIAYVLIRLFQMVFHLQRLLGLFFLLLELQQHCFVHTRTWEKETWQKKSQKTLHTSLLQTYKRTYKVHTKVAEQHR